MLFLDFSSAFNTIQSDILVSKMVQLELNPYLINWYAYFLTDRIQRVKVNRTLSSALITNVGAPQGLLLSKLYFSPFILIAVVLKNVCLKVAPTDQTNTF